MKILNLTQHRATAEQKSAGVVDCHPDHLAALQALLTFEKLPTRAEIELRAYEISDWAMDAHISPAGDIWHDPFDAVMIGGAPFFMSALEKQLSRVFEVFYAFSERVSVEKTLDDGSVEKTNVFKHVGFVRAES